MNKFISILIFFFLSLGLLAQRGYKQLDKFSAEEVAQITWDIENKSTSNYPSDWDKQSAIYLQWSNIYSIQKNRNSIQMVQIVHRKIKINDDASLENFSQIFLPAKQRSYDFKRSVIKSGVRVIKPDGTVNPIKSSEYIKNDDDDTKKLAVPGLEKGDILEYFIYVIDNYLSGALNSSMVEGLNPILFDHFTVQSEYPILNLKYHIQTDKKFRTHLLTSSDKLKVSSSFSDPKLKVYAVTGAQIPYQESQIWSNKYSDLDYIKAMVKLYPRAPNKIAGSLDKEIILEYINENMLSKTARVYNSEANLLHNKYLKKTSNKSLKDYEELEDFYYFCRHHYMEKDILKSIMRNNLVHTIDSYFYLNLIPKLKKLDMKYSILAVLPRNEGNIDHVYTNLEFTYVVRVKVGGKYLYFNSLTPFGSYGKLPSYLEASDAYIVDVGTDYKSIDKIKTPTSTDSENMVTHKVSVKLDLKSDDIVRMVSDIHTKGHNMSSLILPLTNWYDRVIEDDRVYLVKGLLLTEIDIKRQESIETVQKEKKSSLQEQIEVYAKNQYGKDITNISDMKSEFVEDRKGSPYLDIHFECTYNDIIKKVGPNYILKVGKLVGGQIDVGDEPRNFDVHMDYPRSYRYEFKIEIPDGYEPVGLEDMDKDIDNPAGSFQLSHTLKDNVLDISFSKVYKNNFQKQSEWSLMADFLNPANIFETKEILLKKK